MNCPINEEQLALSLSDDLDAGQRMLVSRHLEECDICRNVTAELQLAIQLLVNTFEEPSEQDLRSVRIALEHKLDSESKRRFGWPAAATAVSLAAFLTVTLVRHNTGEKSHPIMAAEHSDVFMASPPAQAMRRLPLKHVRRHIHGAVPLAGLKKVVLNTDAFGKPELRIVTADPDVVILLQMDDNTNAN